MHRDVSHIAYSLFRNEWFSVIEFYEILGDIHDSETKFIHYVTIRELSGLLRKNIWIEKQKTPLGTLYRIKESYKEKEAVETINNQGYIIR
jgi:hypothetical protein